MGEETNEPQTALWWFTQDEECLHGSGHSRDEAIEKGTAYYCGEPFMICQGNHFHNQAPHIGIDYLSEAFDDANSEYAGEDNYPSEDWSDEACRDLEKVINEAFEAWIDRHGYRKAWAIDCGDYERIVPE